jgi:hypothetical protein
VVEVVQRGRPEALPGTGGGGRVAPGADRALRGGREVARDRRGVNVSDSALGRQRNDRSLGRPPAHGDDAGRSRTGRRGRGSRSRGVGSGKPVDAGRARRPRNGPARARRRRQRNRRPHCRDRNGGLPAGGRGARTARRVGHQARGLARSRTTRFGGADSDRGRRPWRVLDQCIGACGDGAGRPAGRAQR